MKRSKYFLLFVSIFALVSCGNTEPQPIRLNSDSCDFCKMTISNSKFASELITDKGRVYKFDDLACMIQYTKKNSTSTNTRLFINDYFTPNKFIPVEQAFFLKGGSIHGPMGGNVAGFENKTDMQKCQSQLNAELISWKVLHSSN